MDRLRADTALFTKAGRGPERPGRPLVQSPVRAAEPVSRFPGTPPDSRSRTEPVLPGDLWKHLALRSLLFFRPASRGPLGLAGPSGACRVSRLLSGGVRPAQRSEVGHLLLPTAINAPATVPHQDGSEPSSHPAPWHQWLHGGSEAMLPPSPRLQVTRAQDQGLPCPCHTASYCYRSCHRRRWGQLHVLLPSPDTLPCWTPLQKSRWDRAWHGNPGQTTGPQLDPGQDEL